MSRDYGLPLARLRRVQSALSKLAGVERSVPAKRTIATALDQLDFLEMLLGELEDLNEKLTLIDQEANADVLRRPESAIEIEAMVALAALFYVNRFLEFRAPSQAIGRLAKGLKELHQSGSSPLFRQRNKIGRKPDPADVVDGKAVIAGLTKLKQKQGMTREAAVAWIAASIPDDLAKRLSTQSKISARAVEEWLDRYGGRYPPKATRKIFTVWSHDDGKPLTKSVFSMVCRRLAERLIVRA